MANPIEYSEYESEESGEDESSDEERYGEIAEYFGEEEEEEDYEEPEELNVGAGAGYGIHGNVSRMQHERRRPGESLGTTISGGGALARTQEKLMRETMTGQDQLRTRLLPLYARERIIPIGIQESINDNLQYLPRPQFLNASALAFSAILAFGTGVDRHKFSEVAHRAQQYKVPATDLLRYWYIWRKARP